MNSFIKSFFYVLSSNVITLIAGLIISFIVPKYLTIEGYGYWQVFLLYSSYVGLVIFGFCDGIYLYYGGKNKHQINHRHLSSMFWGLCIYLILISTVLIIFINNSSIDFTYIYIYISVVLVLIIQCLNSFFVLLDQATGKLKKYAIITSSEKISLVLFIVLLISNQKMNMEMIILYAIISKLIVLSINVLSNLDVILKRPSFNRQTIDQIKIYLKLGLPLTIYGILSMLMTGIGKFFVENNFDIEIFAKYSFSFSTMAIIIQVIHSISTVLYPYLTKTKDDRIINIASNVESKFITFQLLIFMSFYPIIIILEFWLSKYLESIPILAILYPILIFQAKISGLYSVIFKVRKKSKTMSLNAMYSTIVVLILSIIGFLTNQYFLYYGAITVFTYFIWYILNVRSYNKAFSVKVKINYIEYAMLIFFYIFNIAFRQHLISFMVFSILFIMIVWKDRDYYKGIINQVYINKNGEKNV